MGRREMPHGLRRAIRVRSRGSIQIQIGLLRQIRGRALDVALGGLSMEAEVPIGLAGLVAKPLSLEFTPDASTAGPFLLRGCVLRANAETRIIVIGFTKITRAFARWVGTELITGATHDASPQWILIDNMIERRSEIASAFRDACRDVHESATPPEANAHLSLQGPDGAISGPRTARARVTAL
jgi:hypothetical protein